MRPSAVPQVREGRGAVIGSDARRARHHVGMSRAAALLALLLAVLGLAACGSDDAPAPGGPDAVARAAATTANAGTAATRITVEARGFGLPRPLVLTGSGATALDRSELDVTFDLDPVVQLLATQAPEAALLGDGLKLRTLVKGSEVRLQLPQIPGVALPGGATWVGADAGQVAEALGADVQALTAAFRVDPASQLDALAKSGAVKEIGTADLGGEEVRRYAGEISQEESLATVPEADRAAVRRALEKLTAGSPAARDLEVPFEAWVDADGMIRREQLSLDTPAKDGVSPGKLVLRVDYSDFGRELDVRLPPAADTFDATRMLARLAERGASAGVVPAP